MSIRSDGNIPDSQKGLSRLSHKFAMNNFMMMMMMKDPDDDQYSRIEQHNDDAEDEQGFLWSSS